MTLRDELMEMAALPGNEGMRAALASAAAEENAVAETFPMWFKGVELTLNLYRRRIAHLEKALDEFEKNWPTFQGQAS